MTTEELPLDSRGWNRMFKTYLGDYIYAELDEQTHELVLTTENGIESGAPKITTHPS